MASPWLAVVITNAMKISNGAAFKPLKAITNKMIVSASFNFEPWLKLRATISFLLAPAYRLEKVPFRTSDVLIHLCGGVGSGHRLFD